MMANPYQLLIFDWDGTLMDSIGRIIACLQGSISALKLETRPPDELRHVIGLGMREAIVDLYPQADDALIRDFTAAYRERFLHTDNTPAPLFPGVTDLLDDLAEQGYWLAIATGKSRAGLDRVLKDTRLEKRFLATRCADESFSKPHPQMLESLLDELGVAPSDALMIGDSNLDLLMAVNARTQGLGVTSGVHDARELWLHQPRAVLNGVGQLPAWLREGRALDQPLSKEPI
ncbi:HAD family hydrolase [Ectothiorhodospira haloalkaliphila]|uniref:HAD family hydrolase n=2 Tax=Ectothiorhodospira haloalkaliphila TaxID=421628 RepID=W8KPA4_9GAMM|nr:HAD family hydrolase [Ectothiorhodospira haloalkaliphila]